MKTFEFILDFSAIVALILLAITYFIKDDPTSALLAMILIHLRLETKK